MIDHVYNADLDNFRETLERIVNDPDLAGPGAGCVKIHGYALYTMAVEILTCWSMIKASKVDMSVFDQT